MIEFYGSDLARIHATAFERLAEAAATEVQFGAWRRRHEIHRLALLTRETVLDRLAAGGFEAQAEERYEALHLPPGLVVYRAVRRA